MAQEAGRIIHDLMDEPHIAGRRVSVRRVHAMVEERGVDPKTVADRLELDLADVYRALAYYHDHPDEMHEVERRRQRRVDEADDRGAITGPEDL